MNASPNKKGGVWPRPSSVAKIVDLLTARVSEDEIVDVHARR